MRGYFVGVAVVAMLAGIDGCAPPVEPPSPTGTPNPIPTVTSISPSSSLAGGVSLIVTINGTNFIAASMVSFGGTVIANTFQNSTQLVVPVSAAAIAQSSNVAVTVTNPPPGGGTSNAVTFTIASGSNPVPTLDGLYQSCAPIGAQSVVLEVSGSNFVGSSVLRWNGSERPTTVSSATDLTAQIAASDLSTAGTASITIFNSAPGGGTSNTLTFMVAAGGVGPASIAVDPTGRFAYVANNGCPDEFIGNVSMFRIDATTGALTSIGPPVAADFGPHSVAADPSSKFVYVANDGAFEVTGGSVSMYTIDATTGALTSVGTMDSPCAAPPSPGSCAPFSIAVHPSGKFAYVANEGGYSPTSISMYKINDTSGGLTFTGLIAAADRALSVTVHPSGKFAYVTNDGPDVSSSVSAYSIDAMSGMLTSLGPPAAGAGGGSLVVDPTGKFAYVTNSISVSRYTIATTGVLTWIETIAGGGSAIAIHPSGEFAYVTNASSLAMFTIGTTGVLTSIGTIAGGGSAIAIHPSGKFAYVTSTKSNNVSMYSIDPATGALSLIGTIDT